MLSRSTFSIRRPNSRANCPSDVFGARRGSRAWRFFLILEDPRRSAMAQSRSKDRRRLQPAAGRPPTVPDPGPPASPTAPDVLEYAKHRSADPKFEALSPTADPHIIPEPDISTPKHKLWAYYSRAKTTCPRFRPHSCHTTPPGLQRTSNLGHSDALYLAWLNQIDQMPVL